jgi:hypothetical protein
MCLIRINKTPPPLFLIELQLLSPAGLESLYVFPSLYSASERPISQKNIYGQLIQFILIGRRQPPKLIGIHPAKCPQERQAQTEGTKSVSIRNMDLETITGFSMPFVKNGLEADRAKYHSFQFILPEGPDRLFPVNEGGAKKMERQCSASPLAHIGTLEKHHSRVKQGGFPGWHVG